VGCTRWGPPPSPIRAGPGLCIPDPTRVTRVSVDEPHSYDGVPRARPRRCRHGAVWDPGTVINWRSHATCVSYARPEGRGFHPCWVSTPRLNGGGRGLHAQRSPGPNCSVRFGVLSPGFIRQGAGPWRGTFGRFTSDRLAHTALILGGLPPRHRHKAWRERRRVIRPRVQGVPTDTPPKRPFWPLRSASCQTHSYQLTLTYRRGNQPC
jgi:hypothetical protein